MLKILVLADIQTKRPLSRAEKDGLSDLIRRASPDLVVLLGDVIFAPFVLSSARFSKIINSVTEPITTANIPLALVSGNHDLDGIIPIERQLEIYNNYPGCLTPQISYRECAGGYTLSHKELPGLPLGMTLLFLDSGRTKVSHRGIEFLPPTDEQLDYSDKVLGLCKKAVVFQHITVPDVSSAKIVSGIMGEKPCPSYENVRQFPAWVRSGNVSAAVFGHDHKNSFVAELDGIKLIQTPCAGLKCYGTDGLRGGRIVTILDDGTVETEELLH